MRYQTLKRNWLTNLCPKLLLVLTIGLVNLSVSFSDIEPLGNDTYRIPSRNFYEIQAMKLERDWYKNKLEETVNRPDLQFSAGLSTSRGVYTEAGIRFKL